MDKLIGSDIHLRLFSYYKTDKSFALSVYFNIDLPQSLNCGKMFESELVLIYISDRLQDYDNFLFQSCA